MSQSPDPAQHPVIPPAGGGGYSRSPGRTRTRRLRTWGWWVTPTPSCSPAEKDTAGRYTLIDMHVPPGGGPPPHRHDFEEMFTVLEGEVELTFRGERMVAPGR